LTAFLYSRNLLRTGSTIALPSSTFHSRVSLTQSLSCDLMVFGMVVWNFEVTIDCMARIPSMIFLTNERYSKEGGLSMLSKFDPFWG